MRYESLLFDRGGLFFVVETTYGLTVGWVNVEACKDG